MSNKEPSIQKNFVFNIINQIVSVAIPLVVTPFLSRVFKADGVGIQSYTTANITYFMLFCMLGISGYGQRTVAICRNDKNETSKVFWELQIIHFVTLIITTLLYVVLVVTSVKYRTYYIAQYAMLLSSFFDINWFYQAYERFKFIAIRNCIVKISMLAFVFLFVHEKSDLILYLLINAISLLLSNISLWFGLKKYIHKVPFKEMNFKRHYKDIMIFFIPTIAASVYSILDKSVINWVTHDESENGYYEQAYKILQICNVVVQTLSTVSAPRMSNVFSNGSLDEFKKRLNDSLRFMLMISCPVACGVAGIANVFVPIFLGDGYDKVVYLLYIFMPMVVVLGFSVYLDGMYLVPAGRRLESSLAIIAGSVTNLILNYFLVSYFSSIGAAIATLVTECLISGIMMYLSRTMVDWNNIIKCFVKYELCSLVMFVFVKILGTIFGITKLSLFLQITLGAIIYFVILLLIKDSFLQKFIGDVKRKLKM